MENKEVYIGNGVTVSATENTEHVYYLDLEKAEKIVDENLGKEVYVGAKNDWYFTAQPITKEIISEMKKGKLGPLFSSCWSSFSIEVEGESQDCTIEIPSKFHDLAFLNGFQRGLYKIHFWVDNLYFRIKSMPYEELKECAKEIDEVIKKYEQKPMLKESERKL